MIPIDLETLPDPAGPAEYIRSAKAPANYRDPEKIEAHRVQAGREAWLGTSLVPSRGTILCVGLADGLHAEPEVLLGPDEGATLGLLVDWLGRRGLLDENPNAPKPRLLAHNGFGFDFRFLAIRLLAHGHHHLAGVVMPSTRWSGRYQNLLDSKVVLEASLDDCARIAGYTRPPQIKGGEVAAAFARGDLASIVAHCRDDIVALQHVGRMLVRAGLLG